VTEDATLGEFNPFTHGFSLFEVKLETDIVVLAKSKADAVTIARLDADILDQEFDYWATPAKLDNYKNDPSLPWGREGNPNDVDLCRLVELWEEVETEKQKRLEFERLQLKLPLDE